MQAIVHTYIITTFLAALLLTGFANMARSGAFDDIDFPGEPVSGSSQPADALARPVLPKTPATGAPPSSTSKARSGFQSEPDDPQTDKLDHARIPPKPKTNSKYTRATRKAIQAHNKSGRPIGDIKLYAKEKHWGPAVKIQSCYGDNILTRFSITDKGNTGKISFQFKNVTRRNKRRHRHKWVMVKPGVLISGRYIYLRAQTSIGNAILSLRVVGNCIERPARP